MAYSIRTTSSGYLTGSNYSYGGSSGSGSLRKVPLRQQAEVQTQPCPVSTSESPAVSYHKQNTYSYRDSTQGIYDNIRRKKEKEEEDWSRRRRNKEEQNHSQSNPFQDLPISLAIRETMSTMVTNHCAALQKHAVAEKQLDLTDTPERKAPTKKEMFNEHRKKIEGIEEAIHSMEQLRMDLADSLMPGALHKFDELKETLEDVTDIFEKSFEQAARNWPYSDELRLAQNNYLEKAGCLTEVTKKLKKKEKKLAFQEAKMINQGWIAKAKDFFIPVGPKVDRLKNEIMKLKKESEEYQATGLEKLKFRLLNEDIWNEPAEEDSISNEANAISRIKKEVKEYFQKDVEAMQEATAGGWLYSGQPSSGGPTSSPFVTSPSVPTETAGSGRAVAESAQGERCPKQEVNGRSNNVTSSSDTAVSSAAPSPAESSSNVPTQASTSTRRAAGSDDRSPSHPEPKRIRIIDRDGATSAKEILGKVEPTNQVAEELPFAQAVRSKQLDKCCSNCMAHKASNSYVSTRNTTFDCCPTCKAIYYCSETCRQEDLKHHKDECRYIMESGFVPDEYVRLTSRIITRVRAGDTYEAFNGRTLEQLLDHGEMMKELYGPDFTHYDGICKFMGNDKPSKEEFLKYYGKMTVNCYTPFSPVDYQCLGLALYQGLSVHDHSCVPSATRLYDGNRMIYRTMNPDIGYNESLTVAYTNSMKPKKYRENDIQPFFKCTCPRCTSEFSELLERSGACTRCPDGFVLPKEDVPLKCGKCDQPSRYTLQQITEANQTAENYQEYANVQQFLDNGGQWGTLAADQRFTSEVLSPYNLYNYKTTNLVESEFRKRCGSTEHGSLRVEKMLRTLKQAVQEYSPYGSEHKRLLLKIVDETKFFYNNYDNSPEQLAKVTSDFAEAICVVQECYGRDHALTRKLKEAAEQLRPE